MVDPGALPEGYVVCPRCGVQVPENQTYYEEDGEICARCFGTGELIEKNVKAMKGMAGSSLGLGIISLLFNYYGIVSFLALMAGISALTYPSKATSESKPILQAMGGTKAMAIIGIVLSCITLAIVVLLHLGIAFISLLK